MKKIFAIALALVMVLSMASAFAWCVTDINWACATDVCENGTGSVEVIPYVKGNGCGTGNTWTESTCAGAVNGDLVYAALKVTVDEDPNLEWWAKATLKLETKGVKNLKSGEIAVDPEGAVEYEFDAGDVAEFIAALEEGELKAGEYYLYASEGAWIAVKAKDFEAGKTTLFSAKVSEAAKVKFCATLESEVDGVNGYVSVDPYKIAWRDGKIDVWNGKKGDDLKWAMFYINGDDQIEKVEYKVGEGDEQVVYTFTDFGFIDEDGKASGYCAPFDWLEDVMEDLELNFRNTCYTKKAFTANFGWEDKVESCFSWNSDVQAVVNAECVVAIPKTGDASVLAWLF